MNLEKLTRKIIALENRNQVNYASVAGNAFSLSKGETTVGIDQNGHMVCNNIFEATNVKPNNEKRLKEAENDIERLEQKKADINHTHDEYALKEHEHDKYALKTHNHDEYALKEHEHDEYALKEHEHDIDDINGIDENLESLRAFINQINNMFIIKEHTHEIKDVNGLQETIDSFQESYVDNLESLQQSLTEAFRLKADKEHTHTAEEVFMYEGGPDVLSAIQSTTLKFDDKADKEHTHEIEDVNGLTGTLSNKANVGHTHLASDITDITLITKEIYDTINQLASNIGSIPGQIWTKIYPVGSIYTSMNSTSPETLFGGTWEQITDRFLYCANGSKQEGGNKKITVENLPAHTHAEMCTALEGLGFDENIVRRTFVEDGSKYQVYPTGAQTGSTGSGTDYMPPYITCYAWYRTA